MSLRNAGAHFTVLCIHQVPVGRAREVLFPEEVKQKLGHRAPSRDPRFESLSGKLNSDLFQKSYAFVENYRKDEIKDLKKVIGKVKDEEERWQLQKDLASKQQEQALHEKDMASKKSKSESKKKEREAVLSGKNPFFLKKNDQKKKQLKQRFVCVVLTRFLIIDALLSVFRYQKLESEGKLTTFLGKKRKQNATKDRKKLPKQRRGGGDEGEGGFD